MDSATRIKILGRLAQSRTPASEEAIARACAEAFTVLLESTRYDELEYALEVLATVGFRRSEESVTALSKFLRSAENLKLHYSEEYSGWGQALNKYISAYTLMSKAIQVLSALRYLETPLITDILLWATTHHEESVRTAAVEALRSLAKYNLSVFYGTEDGSRRGIGAAPQVAVLNSIESKSDSFLIAHLSGVLTLIEGMLSTSMESTKWSSSAVTLLRSVTPAAGDVPTVRRRSVGLLKRIYGLTETTRQKLFVIGTLNTAARAESHSAVDKDYAEMIAASTQEVLALLAQIAESESDLQIVQKIEHDSYWIHYHSPSDAVRSAALAVKAIIDANFEYSLYKILIGFEGVFDEWSDLKGTGSSTIGTLEWRTNEAKVLAAHISDDDLDLWKQRILRFARTESNDMATFPVFYEFLADVAKLYPDFALDLLANHSERLSAFLIPLLRGVWDGEQQSKLLPIMQRWIDEATPDAKSPLYACAKLFLSAKTINLDMLERILAKAAQLNDASVIRQVASVGIVRAGDEGWREQLRELFLQALSRLTELADASWVSDIWYREEAKERIMELSSGQRKSVLENLHFLPQIDYQAEDVLAIIAKQVPGDVVDLLCARVYESNQRARAVATNDDDRYEQLPYKFHSLRAPLEADAAMVVQKVLYWYHKDPSLFLYRGAKLLRLIFPEFPETFQGELLKLIRTGAEAELEFVTTVLRAYDGQSFIHPIAKQLIKVLPSDSELLNEISIALQSTGVVSGEYGMSEAYEKKRLEVLDWLEDSHERVRAFAAKYIRDLESMRDFERRRADESIALRKFEYGEE